MLQSPASRTPQVRSRAEPPTATCHGTTTCHAHSTAQTDTWHVFKTFSNLLTQYIELSYVFRSPSYWLPVTEKCSLTGLGEERT